MGTCYNTPRKADFKTERPPSFTVVNRYQSQRFTPTYSRQQSVNGTSLPAREMRKSFSRSRLYVALYDYAARMASDLSFRKGDELEILDSSNPDWWKARHRVNKLEGYVPFNYIAVQDTPQAEDWYHQSISRKYAENLLLRPGNTRGTFLVRQSETAPGSYSLSVFDCDAVKGDHIKHYKIRNLDNGGVYITPRLTFSSLSELVEHYKKQSDGLCHKLTRPCPKDGPPLPQDMNWEIARDSVKLVRLLGKGNFGEVWAGKLYKSEDVAVKMLNSETCTAEAFLEEANTMKKLRHDKLVQLIGVCTKDAPIYIITELMANGSLLDYLRHGAGQHVDVTIMIDIAGQIASGMEYLEKSNFIHRDLAARNILVGENNLVKIADFGLARLIREDEYTAAKGAKFPVKWTAPEAALFGKFTIKSDVWSYGILLMELITRGQVPYPGMNGRETLEQLERGYRMVKSRDCPEEMYTMMLKCWAARPEDRPTFEFLRAFFEDFFISSEAGYRESDNF